MNLKHYTASLVSLYNVSCSFSFSCFSILPQYSPGPHSNSPRALSFKSILCDIRCIPRDQWEASDWAKRLWSINDYLHYHYLIQYWIMVVWSQITSRWFYKTKLPSFKCTKAAQVDAIKPQYVYNKQTLSWKVLAYGIFFTRWFWIWNLTYSLRSHLSFWDSSPTRTKIRTSALSMKKSIWTVIMNMNNQYDDPCVVIVVELTTRRTRIFKSRMLWSPFSVKVGDFSGSQFCQVWSFFCKSGWPWNHRKKILFVATNDIVDQVTTIISCSMS